MERRLDQQRQQLSEQHAQALQLQEQQAAVLTSEKLALQRREAEAAAQQLEERLTDEIQQVTKVSHSSFVQVLPCERRFCEVAPASPCCFRL